MSRALVISGVIRWSAGDSVIGCSSPIFPLDWCTFLVEGVCASACVSQYQVNDVCGVMVGVDYVVDVLWPASSLSLPNMLEFSVNYLVSTGDF